MILQVSSEPSKIRGIRAGDGASRAGLKVRWEQDVFCGPDRILLTDFRRMDCYIR
jgi:hypothetical protein